MSKTIDAPLLAHYALGTTTVAHALFIERTDGELFGWTEHDVDDEIDGFTYVADDPGFSVSDIVIASGCNVGNMGIKVLHSGEVFTSLDVLSDIWQNARFLIFRYNYLEEPITSTEACLAGTFGQIKIGRNTLEIELHDLRRYLNHPVGGGRQKTCRYRLGSTSMREGGLCMKDISAAPFTVTFTVSHVTGTGRVTFRDSSLAHAADWFGEGEVIFLTGDLQGISKKVHSYDADGTFHLSLPLFLPVQVGDTGTAIVGCRKRRTEDCFIKLDNVLNHGGEADARPVDTLTRRASADTAA